MKIRGTVFGIAAVVVTAMIALHANAYERAKADITISIMVQIA